MRTNKTKAKLQQGEMVFGAAARAAARIAPLRTPAPFSLKGRQNRFAAGVPYLQRQPHLPLKPERLPRGGPKPDLGLDGAQEGILPKTQP